MSMEEILYHLLDLNYCNRKDFVDFRWCMISSVYRSSSFRCGEGSNNGEAERMDNETKTGITPWSKQEVVVPCHPAD